MGRLIAVVLFIAVLVPGVLLARAWALAAGRRAVASAGVEFATPTPEGLATLHRQAQHGRRVRRLGLLLGVVAIVASVVVFAEASVFLWLPALLTGLLAGVVLAEATRPRPRWRLSAPPRRPRRGEQISPWLLWTTRAVAVAEVAVASVMWHRGDLPDSVGWVAVVVPLATWLLAEVALLRALLRPLAGEGADVPVDEALRTWTAHLVTAATSVLALLPLGALLLAAGIDLGDRVTENVDLLPVALVAGGFAGLAAGLAVAVFLVTWLRPVRTSERALAG
ncbi:hypothetical protein SAMN05660464_2564 [Geodermatophilus dictyosporus]|uniref:Uncharacterized protein n=1 Tax=Geodermatophilus dictyosporus TaxID=1523247 RepID=A0A1I5NK38_9ACTN|nr:hypothetical protein [Geodermatophilus dictyosporus]SFP22139.1 hypothetical protein SAMN05660464_2564 [Geodermatophilus dictyosporus]